MFFLTINQNHKGSKGLLQYRDDVWANNQLVVEVIARITNNWLAHSKRGRIIFTTNLIMHRGIELDCVLLKKESKNR